MLPIKAERPIGGAHSSNVDLSPAEVTTIRALIDRRAEAQSETPFLISPESGQIQTFCGLKERSQVISAQLHGWGLAQGDKVAFLMENSSFTAQLFLGVMYGGYVSVPLNVRAGVSQLTYTLDHCDAKVLFIGEGYEGLATEVVSQVGRSVRVIRSDTDGMAALRATTTQRSPAALPSPDDIAMLMYTSGSTGQPKAAVHTHRTILAGGRNAVAAHQLTASDRSLLVLPLYHINAECVTLIPALLTGGSVVVPYRFNVSQFWDWLENFQCTWSAIVPTIVSQLLDWNDPKADQRGPVFQRIRFLRSSSAPLAPSLQREFFAKFPLVLIQAMGSSEGGNIFSNPLPPGENKIGSPGLPWGFEVKIVDRQGRELRGGEPGEMLIRGEALSCAYYKEPEATAAAFDTEGWLHTGDLAYRDNDGYFFVVGRSKELIIKGGVNIAPRQIDDVLESHPGVLEAAAVGVPDRYLGEDVVAFVVLRAGVESDERELLEFCERRLGAFKTPTRIHFVLDLPKGPSGKVQRLRLLEQTWPADASGSATAPKQFALARGSDQKQNEDESTLLASIETAIAEIWSEVLKVPQVRGDDNFFALGGDSLLAIQCVSRLRDKIAVRLTLTDVFERGTVTEQAALIRERHAAAENSSIQSGRRSSTRQVPDSLQPRPAGEKGSIPLRDRSLPYQLSPLQERLWFMERLNVGQPVYNEVEAVRLRGELNVKGLEQALNDVVARHEMLRTTIREVDGVPMAEVRESYQLRLKIIDLSDRADGERETELRHLLSSEPRIPYQLEVEPAIRATLIRVGTREHVFILMMHHLICDWSSEGVLWRELSVFYRKYCHNESFTLPALVTQYGDYAVWQRKQLTETSVADDLAFWVGNLQGAPPLLELPMDRLRPQVTSYRGARQRFRLTPKLTEALRRLSGHERKSLFAIFTAALDVLLYRYTGQSEILLGVPIAERDRAEFQSMIGFLLHTHVLRTAVHGELTFRELVGRVQQGALKLYEHRSVPFDRVVRALQPERSLSYSPLFQVMINWRDRDQQLSFIGLEGLDVESVLVDSKISKFDLTLFLTDMGEEVWAEMEYSTDLFDATSIERMFGNYQTLLEAVTADPGQRIDKLPLLADDERRQLLVEWNDTKVDYPACACIHEPFEAQASRCPDQVAVVFERQSLSYGELNRRANQLAHHLKGFGVGPDVLVGLCVKRSLDMVIGLLGILKAGAAYVPMDPSYPRERLQYILEDSRASIVLTQESLVNELPSLAGRAICLDKDWGNIARESDENLAGEVNPEDLAYVLFTSGSTGKPKGVEISHRAVINFLDSMRKEPGIEAQDTLLSVTTLSFDIFGLEIWLPLTSGAKVVIAPEEVTRDGKELAALLRTSRATVMQATPSTWRLLLDSGWEGNPDLKILCGGEAWPAQLAEQLLPMCASLWNMYGPTETTIWSAVSQVREGVAVLIGHPIANTDFYVVDSNLQPMPVGVPGELLIGGAGLARGYLNRPDLTAEKFIANPFRTDTGCRLYRTGDLVRYRTDGKLEFLGRTDQQVKIRGFRIELGEIEAVLRGHAGVREAVVVVRQQTEKQLIAFVVLAGEPSWATAELRDYLKQKLPAYMIPTAFSVLESLPLTPNGKVDRKALRGTNYSPSERQSTQEVALPQTLLEMQLLQIWHRVLHSPNIGVRDNFFEIGGHSLLAVSIINEINKLLDINLTIPIFFLNPSIQGIARTLEEEKNHNAVPTLVSLCQRPSHAEGTLYFVEASMGMCRLAERLGSAQASFAAVVPISSAVLEAAVEGRSADLPILEAMAAPYAELIGTHQDSGPCVLIGHSFGGALAFEVAHQLQRQGKRVDIVVLLDATLQVPRWNRLKKLNLKRLWWAINWRLGHVRSAVAERARALFLRSPHTLDPVTSHEVRGQLYRPFATVPWEILQKVYAKASHSYRGRQLKSFGILFRAQETNRYEHFADMGWGGLFSEGLEIITTPGDHMSLLEDANLDHLSQALQERLSQLVQFSPERSRVA